MSRQTYMVPRLKDHKLIGHGQPYDNDGTPLPPPGTGNPVSYGYAYCTCGEHSKVLSNNSERKRWHVRHREEKAGVPWL